MSPNGAPNFYRFGSREREHIDAVDRERQRTRESAPAATQQLIKGIDAVFDGINAIQAAASAMGIRDKLPAVDTFVHNLQNLKSEYGS